MSPNGTDPDTAATQAATAPALAEGLPEIAGYRMLRRLGEGGMAEIYLAIQLSLERQVAIKVLSFERSVTEADALRFEREARMVAKLDHPSIVGIFDVGRTRAGQLYYAMPYLARGDLAQAKITGDEQAIAATIGAVCDALGYAHAQGVVHRDVKPENILFDHAGRARLGDFGIALSREHDHRVTGPNKALGSSGYMSPEQARGLPLDGRSDLYSLGVVCYELLTGGMPYLGPDALAVAMAHANDPVPRLPVTLRRWQAFVDRALAKDADKRFQTAAEMRAALDGVIGPVPNTREHAAAPGGGRVAVLLAALVLSLGALVWTRTIGEPEAPPDNGAAADLSHASPPDATPATEPPPIEGSKLAVLDAHALDDEIKAAYAQLKRGRLFEPEGDNASERFLALYLSVPQSAEARAGLDAVVDQAAARAERAIAEGDGARAAKLHEAGASLAERSRIRPYQPWEKFRARYSKALDAALDRIERTLDGDALAAIAPALDAAAPGSKDLAARRARLAALPKAGQQLSDQNGPGLAFVPASFEGQVLDHAYALGATEVTRADYLAFLEQSRRPLSKCRDGAGLFSYLRRRDVRKPGFEQAATHPVVCVSHEDAVAYAQWLSQRTGQRYRLPTAAEWQHAARGLGEPSSPCSVGNVFDRDSAGTTLSNRYECSDGFRFTAPAAKFAASKLGLYDLIGNVAEWSGDCAIPKKDKECQVLGSSYEDGSKRPLLGADARDADSAAPEVGFRVLRELTIDTIPGSPPASASKGPRPAKKKVKG